MRRSRLSTLGLAVRDRFGTRLGDESGIALVMALGIMLVLVITLTTVITFTAAGARDSHRVNAGQKATALAEGGINNALAVLNQNYPCTACYPGDSTLLPARTTSYSSGTVTWSGVLDGAPPGAGWADEWRITATGSVPNPTGPNAGPVTRTVSAVVPVIPPTTSEIGDENPLNYIYAHDELEFLQSVIVASPIYATTNLRLQSSSTISEFIGNVPGKKNRLAVGGVFYGMQNANRIGHVNGSTSPTYSLEKAYIVGGCNTKNYDNNVSIHACAFGDGLPSDRIWADATGTVIPPDFLDYVPQLTCCKPYPDNPQLAPVQTGLGDSNMGRAYKTADLGPRSKCTTGSVPFRFDTASGVPDNLINNSATPAGSAAINLTPDANGPVSQDYLDSYSCKSARGEISWDNVAKKFRVQGTVFIDGSAAITSQRSNGATVTGQGALFLTGTFLMNNALMCVVIDPATASSPNKRCHTATDAWDPNEGALVVIADGDGGYDVTQNQNNNIISGEGITIKTSHFQGGLIANKDITVDTTSNMQGPMISVYHDVHAGQSGVLTFPPISFAPSGADAAIGPPPVAQLLPPRQFSGG
jgi:hypothetical protein